MTASLTKLSIAEARDRLASGDCSAVELTRAHLDAIDRARDLNALIRVTPEIAMERATAADARRAAGGSLGPLDGVPIAIKDLFCTAGTATTAGSHILDGFVPTYESTVTANLKDTGAIMLGKANLDEFAMGSSNITSYYGPVKTRGARGTARTWFPAVPRADPRPRWRAVFALRPPAPIRGDRYASRRRFAASSG